MSNQAHEHPIRKAKIHVFQRIKGEGGDAPFIARLHPYNNWPIIFRGKTAEAAEAKVIHFMAEVIEKHEAEAVTKQKARDAAKLKSKKGPPHETL
jgi:enoyl-CoA hydratase/carnithine racemase